MNLPAVAKPTEEEIASTIDCKACGIANSGMEPDFSARMTADTRALVEQMRATPKSQPPKSDAELVTQIRDGYRQVANLATEAKNVETISERIEFDDYSLPVRLYVPKSRNSAATLFIHGGGFVSVDLDTHERVLQHLAAESEQTVVAVEYRLAPEHPSSGMDFGLSRLGEAADAIEVMMLTYGLGSADGRVEDSRTHVDLVAHMRALGDALILKVAGVSEERLSKPQSKPFLAKELPTVGGLLAYVYTTHIALHMGQLSQIRRELGMPSQYQFGANEQQS